LKVAILQIRPFRNVDPPKIVSLWRAQPLQRGLAQQVDVSILEALVFAKIYFDPAGFLVAAEGDRVIGFAHAGFGPDSTGSRVSTESGVICLVMVDPQVDFSSVAIPLLKAAEDYLRARGAQLIYGGAIRPVNPFYLGLYGGSELPGVLRSHTNLVQLFESCGYRAIDETLIFQCDLSCFRPPVDRQQLLLKRTYHVGPTMVEQDDNWWTACTSPFQDSMNFAIFGDAGTSNGQAIGHAVFWLMDPLSRGWGCVAVGMTQLFVEEAYRRKGFGTYLVADCLRQLKLSGVNLIEAQTMCHNQAAVKLYRKLGFQQIDQGIVFRKESD
jgi:GNAT superfamily N-acetyltransferase